MTTKKNVLLTLMFLLTTVQVSAQDKNKTLNPLIDGSELRKNLEGMLLVLSEELLLNN